MKRLVLALLLALVALSFCPHERANAAAFNACSSWGTPDDSAAFGVMVCMGTVSAGPPPACPQGTSHPDGCPGANAASTFQVLNAFAHGGRFNTLAGTTTDYSTTNIETSGVNAPGVDYPVANYTAVSAMADPLVGLVSLGCTQTTFNVAGNPILTCGSGFTSNRIGEYDFSARFGHPCVILNVTTAAPIGGKLTIQDNNFENDGSCGFAPSGDYVLSVGNLNYATDITFNSFNGHGTSFPYSNCGKAGFPGTNPCNGSSAIITEGVVNIEYNAFVDWSGRPIGCVASGTNPALNSLTFKYNYLQGWDYEPFNGHAEFVLCNNLTTNPSMALQDYQYNTIVNTTDAMGFGPSPFWVASTGYLSVNTINIIGNTVLPSLVGNSTYSATVTGCIGTSMSGGVCSGPGSNFYAISVSSGDRIGHGEAVGGAQGGSPVCSVPSGTMTVTSITAPIGGASTVTVTGSPTIGLIPSYTITMSSGYGTNAMTILKQLTATGNIFGGAGTYSVSNTNTGSFTGSATATTPGGGLAAWLSQNLGGGSGSGSSWTISSDTNPPGNWLVGPATCAGIVMFGPSSNIGVASITHMANLGALTITGNYSDSVPTYAQRGAGFFTLGGDSGGSIICGVPSVVSGNVDMSGIAGSTITNPSFGSSSFSSGC